jgi:hypothetical protein
VIEQDAVGAVQPVGLAIIPHDPIGIELRDGIGAARMKGRGFALGRLLHQAVELGGGGLVEPACPDQLCGTQGFQQPQRAERIDIGGVVRRIEADGHVALRGEVIDLVGLGLFHQAGQHRGVGHVAMMQRQQSLGFRAGRQEVLDPRGVAAGGASHQAVDDVALGQQQFCKIGAVLARNAGD